MNIWIRRWIRVCAIAPALLCLAHVLIAAGIAERLKPEIDKALAFKKAKQYDQELAICDRLLGDPEVAGSAFDGLIKSMAVAASAGAKRPDDVIRRGQEYLTGRMDDRDQATIMTYLIQAYAEKGQVVEAKTTGKKALELKGADAEQKAEIRTLMTNLETALKAPAVDTSEVEAMMVRGQMLEAEGKVAVALDVYRGVLKHGKVTENIEVDAAERILAISGKTMGAAEATALADGVVQALHDDELIARVKLALTRKLVRVGELDQARQMLADESFTEAGAAYVKQAKEVIGDEMLKMADEESAEKRYDAAAALVKKALAQSLTATQRTTAQSRYALALVAAGRTGEAVQATDDFYDKATKDADRGAALIVKTQVMLAKGDVEGAWACVTAFERLKEAYGVQLVMIRALPTDYLVVQAKTLEADGKVKEAWAVADRLLSDPKLLADHAGKVGSQALALMGKALPPEEVIVRCDRLLADRKFDPYDTGVLNTKYAAQMAMGKREDARKTAEYLMGRPDFWPPNKEAMTKEWGDNLQPRVLMDKAQAAAAEARFERTIHSNNTPALKAEACQALIQLLSRSGRAEDAEKRSKELLGTLQEPYSKQFVCRELYDIQVRRGALDEAMATTRLMIEQVAATDVPSWARMRGLADEVITDLTKQLQKKTQLDRMRELLPNLRKLLDTADLAGNVEQWCRQKVLGIYQSTGDTRSFVKFYRESAGKTKLATDVLGPIIGPMATIAEDEPELMDDVIFAAQTYLKANSGPTEMPYTSAVFNSICTLYVKRGEPLNAAKFMEDAVKDVPAQHRACQDAKCRAVQIYLDAGELKESRRAAVEFETKWPTCRERAELTLAIVDAHENPDASLARLARLPATTQAPDLWLATGKEIADFLKKAEDWKNVAAVYEEAAKRLAKPDDKQAAFKEIYDARMKDGNVDGSVLAVRSMVSLVCTAAPKNSGSVRPAARTAVMELMKLLGGRDEREKAEPLLKDLEDKASAKGVDEDARAWAVETAFDGFLQLGDQPRALQLLREKGAAFKRLGSSIPGTLVNAADGVGKDADSIKADEIARLGTWYIEKNADGRSTYYCGTIFTAVVAAYTKEKRPTEAARFIERVIKEAGDKATYAEEWKLRAAQIYADAGDKGEARRTAQEFRERWPTSRDKADVFLAKLDAADDPEAAFKRLLALPDSPANVQATIDMGKGIASDYQKRGEIEKAVPIYQQLINRAGKPADKQALYEALYGAQARAGELDGAIATARSLTALSCSATDAASAASTRSAARRIIADLGKELAKRGTPDRLDGLSKDLADKLAAGDLDDAARAWNIDTTFYLFQLSGNAPKALRLFRENEGVFKAPVGGLPEAIIGGLRAVEKAQLGKGQSITMGEEAGAGTVDDVAFAARWLFKNDPKTAAVYAGYLMANLEGMWRAKQDPGSMARFAEATVLDSPQDANLRKTWALRTAELYYEAGDFKDAKRSAVEVEKTWPDLWEQTQFVQAKIELHENPKTAVDRLVDLHSKAKDQKIWSTTGLELVKIYQGNGEWQKSLALHQEMGVRNPSMLPTWAYQYRKDKRIEEAATLYRQLRTQDPNNYSGYSGEASCLTELKRCDEAVALYDQAARRFQGAEREAALLAAADVVANNLHQYADAEQRYRSFTVAYPNSRNTTNVWIELVRTLNKLSRYPESAELARKLADEKSDDRSALSFRMLRSEALSGQGKGAEALAVLEEAVVKHKLDRQALSPWMMLDYAAAYKAAGDKVTATTMANDLIKKYPTNALAVEEAKKFLKGIN